LEVLPLNENSNDFVFDNELLVQAVYFKFKIGELSCPTKYFKDASVINFNKSMKYGVGVLATLIKYILAKLYFKRFAIFSTEGQKLQNK